MSEAVSEISAEKDAVLYRIRHSLAHIMAQAVLEIRPEAKMAFGPPVDFGFYYDFDFGDSPVGERDLEEIENRMRKIIKEKQPFEQAYKTLDEAVAYLEQTDQSYKIEYAKELVESGRARDEGLGFYTNGPFVDMCEGPHLETTGKVPKACFKLDGQNMEVIPRSHGEFMAHRPWGHPENRAGHNQSPIRESPAFRAIQSRE